MIENFSSFSKHTYKCTEKGARPKMPSRKNRECNLPKICIKGRGILNILLYIFEWMI